MFCRRKSKSTRLISFSGIDGAGKSTQIQALYSKLRERRLDILVLTFWDDVAALKRIRETSAQTLFKSETGVGTPSAPVKRRDKNVRSWPMTWVRLCLYALDVVVLRVVTNEAMHADADVVIFDRYIYDELANLNLRNRAIRIYANFILKLAPKPHVSFLLDADPIQARARKPEYPVDFLQVNRLSYLTMSDLARGMTVIDPMAVGDVEETVLKHALNVITIDDLSDKAKLDGPYTRPAAF
jgi:thymidylate kinase